MIRKLRRRLKRARERLWDRIRRRHNAPRGSPLRAYFAKRVRQARRFKDKTLRKLKRAEDRKIFQRKGEPAHEVAERFARKFNLIITSAWRSWAHNAAVGGSPTSWHPRGYAFDFIPKRSGFWGALDRAKAWIYSKVSHKFVEVLWRVPNHNIGDNPHLHIAINPAYVSPTRRQY